MEINTQTAYCKQIFKTLSNNCVPDEWSLLIICAYVFKGGIAPQNNLPNCYTLQNQPIIMQIPHTLCIIIGIGIVYFVSKGLMNSSQTGQTEGRRIQFVILKLVALVPLAALVSLLLTGLEVALIILNGTSDSRHFRFEDHAWVKQMDILLFLLFFGGFLYFGSRIVLGKSTLKGKRNLIVGLCFVFFGAPIVGALALGNSNFQPRKPVAPISIGVFKFQITPVAGWQVARDDLAPPGESPLVLTAPLKDDYAASLNLVVAPLLEEPTLRELSATLIKAYPKIFSGFTLISQGKTTLNGLPATFITATHRTLSPGIISPHKLRMYQVLAIRDQQLFAFTCNALDSNYTEYEPDFQFLLNSVRWK